MDDQRFQCWLASLNEISADLSSAPEELTPEQKAALQAALSRFPGDISAGQADPQTQGAPSAEVLRLLGENQRQKALLEAVFESDPSGIAVLVGADLRFAFTNPAYRYLCPDPLFDPLDKPYNQVWPNRSRYGHRDRFRVVLKTGQPFQVVGVEHTFPDGTRRVFTLQARRIDWENQSAVLLILWDITEQKRAEEELRSVALFPEQNPDPLLRISRDGILLYINQACRQLLPEVQVGAPMPAFWRDLSREADQTGEKRIIDFKYQDRVYAFQVVPIPGSGYVNLYGRDITERRQANQELSAANERLRSVLASITELYAVFDRDWRIVDLNRVAEEHYFPTQPPGAMRGRNLWEALPQAVGSELHQGLQQAMTTGQPAHFEAGPRITGKWYEVHAYPREELFELYMHDISERKHAEQALRASEARLKRAEEIAHLGSWELDLTTNRLTWSDEIYRMFGLQPQEFGATYEAFLEAVHPQDRAAVDAAYSGSLREGRDTYEIQHRVVRRSTGEVRVVHEKCEHIRDSAGQIIRSIGMVQDITDRVRAEERLEVESQRYRDVLASITDAYFALDREWRFIEVNHTAVENFLLQPADQLLGKNFWEVFPRAVDSGLYRQYHRAVAEGQPVHFEEQSRETGGWFEVFAYPRGDRLEVYSRDITARKKSEEHVHQLVQELAQRNVELEVERERWQGVVEGIADEVWVCDPQGRMGLINLPSMTAMGLTEFADKTYPEVNEYVEILTLDGQVRPMEQAPLLRALRGEIVRGEEIMVQRQTGRRRYRQYSAAPTRDATGAVTGSVAIVRDITALMEAQQAAHTRAIQVELQRRLLEQREQERLQIARDLHDGPVQALTAATFTVSSLLMGMENPEMSQQLEALRDSLQDEIKGLRAYAGELRPPALARFGLSKGIQSHLEVYQQQHPELSIQLIEDPQEGELVPEPQRLAAYRIYQEAMTNIAKHAQASAVRIHLHKDTQRVLLEIQDDGMGFTLPNDWMDLIHRGHLGLAGMRERAEAAGGQIEISSFPGQGTTIRVNFPLQREEERNVNSES